MYAIFTPVMLHASLQPAVVAGLTQFLHHEYIIIIDDDSEDKT